MSKKFEMDSDIGADKYSDTKSNSNNPKADYGGELAKDTGMDVNAGGDNNIKYCQEPKHKKNRLPTDRSGMFDGKRGESRFHPNNEAALNKMREFGDSINAVEYKGGSPDFTPFKNHNSPWGNIDSQVEIGHMTDRRTNPSYEYGRRSDGHDPKADLGNYAQADNAMAEKIKESYPDISGADIEKYRIDNGLTWHEYPDGKAMQLIPTEIHDACRHSGGVSEMRERMAWGDVDALYKGSETNTDIADDTYNPMYVDPKYDPMAYSEAMNEDISTKKPKQKTSEHPENELENQEQSEDGEQPDDSPIENQLESTESPEGDEQREDGNEEADQEIVTDESEVDNQSDSNEQHDDSPIEEEPKGSEFPEEDNLPDDDPSEEEPKSMKSEDSEQMQDDSVDEMPTEETEPGTEDYVQPADIKPDIEPEPILDMHGDDTTDE